MMQGRRYWVEEGKLSTMQGDGTDLSTSDERQKFEQGHVRLTTGDLGTEIKWHVQSPCLASLFVAAEWMRTARLPVILRFYVAGWFEEFHRDYRSVVQRLEDVIARGDRHFTCRTMVKQFEVRSNLLTPLLSQCITRPESAIDFAVECVYEDSTRQFQVERVGKKSVINQVYGTMLTSFPCQSSGQYSQTVSEGYLEVLDKGAPRYDHVLAAMRMPDNVVFWVPYRRLVIPKSQRPERPSVWVISELANVDIQLI